MVKGAIATEQLRAWWAHRQGLDAQLASKPPADVLTQAGWARSVGGSAPYLSLHARAELTRAAIDASVAKLKIHELPSARACTYVVPASDYALALTIADAVGDGDMNAARKLGVTDKEVDALCTAVVKALKSGEAMPDEIRERVGDKARSLGPEGVKKGLSSTLPLALARLQTDGEIRRVPTNGRLDQQRYRYKSWSPNPRKLTKLSGDEAYVELARRYFAWVGAASLGEFQWFTGLSAKRAMIAIEPLQLVTVGERLATAEAGDELHAFKVPKAPIYRLLPSIDSLVLLRRNHVSLLDEKDAALGIGVTRECKTLSALSDLPTPIIVDRGRIVGLWEYDPARSELVWLSFVKKSKELLAAVARTESFIREELGDARGFSLDSPKARQPRIDALRAASK